MMSKRLRCFAAIALAVFSLTAAPLFADTAVKPAASQVYSVSEVDRPPKVMVTFKTAYPAELKAQGIEGEVVVECVVDFDGVVRDPVVKSSTRKEFELPALQSVVKWKFRPAKKGKETVNVRLEIPVKFEAKKK